MAINNHINEKKSGLLAKIGIVAGALTPLLLLYDSDAPLYGKIIASVVMAGPAAAGGFVCGSILDRFFGDEEAYEKAEALDFERRYRNNNF